MGFETTGSFIVSGGSLTGLNHRAWNAGPMHDFWFDTGVLQPLFTPFTASGTGTVLSGDSIFTVSSGAQYGTDFSWPYTIPPNSKDPYETISRYTLNSGVIIPDTGDSSKWLRQSNGTGALILSCTTRTATGLVTTYTGYQTPIYTFQNYGTGCLRLSAISGVDNRLVGKEPLTALPIFSTQDHTTPTYVRNTGCWAYGVDLTPISPWNSAGANFQAGTLISPKHVLFAAHYAVPAGTTIRFVAADNTVTTRTITGLQTLPGYTSYYPDCTVGGLDSDVPGTISFARVLPTNYTGNLPGSVSKVPALCLDYEEKALVTDLSTITSNSGMYGAMVVFQAPTDPTRLRFYEDKIGGDSGNPAFIIVDGKVVLLNVWTFGGPGAGTSVVYWKNELNAIMTNLGGGYTLTDADFSSYPTYLQGLPP